MVMPILKKLVVQDFRNIRLAELEFSPNINCISGGNGEGKTNLLDTIHYLSMTKSAFSSSDRYNFRYGTDSFSLSGNYLMDNGLMSKFMMQVMSSGEKKMKRDDKQYGRISEHIGVLPVIYSNIIDFLPSETDCLKTDLRVLNLFRYMMIGCLRRLIGYIGQGRHLSKL